MPGAQCKHPQGTCRLAQASNTDTSITSHLRPRQFTLGQGERTRVSRGGSE